MARKQSGGISFGHDFSQGLAGILASDGVERPRHFWGVDCLADRQPEYRNDGGVAYLAEKLCAKRVEHLLQSLAIMECGQVSGYGQPPGALGDAGDQHLLLVAYELVQFPL